MDNWHAGGRGGKDAMQMLVIGELEGGGLVK